MKLLIIFAALGLTYGFHLDPAKHEWLIETETFEFCNVTLTCLFNTPVYCQWKRNDRVLDIGDRYTYVKGSRDGVRDCSLQINNIKPTEFGFWICEGYSTPDNAKSPKFKTIFRVNHDFTHAIQPKTPHGDMFSEEHCRRSLSTIYGPHLILLSNFTTTSNSYDCKFGSYVDECLWRSTNETIISDREVDFIKHLGKDTDDCSMKVNTKLFAKAKKVTRCEAKKDLMTITGRTGGTVWLNCHANKAVNCLWKRNHEEVPITGRLKYDVNNGVNVQDCSIKITNFANTDTGLWTCAMKPIQEDSTIGTKILNVFQVIS